jgi:hypothetical protein
MPIIHAEQAVYGSFPFWSKGYGLLSNSPGCRHEWVREFETVCQLFGEPASGASGDGALLCRRIRHGPWLLVRVASQGADDRGRPGALAFHGLFLTDAEFAKIHFDPFLVLSAFRSDWAEAAVLEPLSISAGEPERQSPEWPLAAELLGRGVVIESATPIEEIAMATWRALRLRDRRANSFATLTFRDPLRFSLAAVPRIAEDVRTSGVHILTPDEALQDARHLAAESRTHVHETSGSPALVRRAMKAPLVAIGTVILLVAMVILGRRLAAQKEATPPPEKNAVSLPTLPLDGERPVEPDERARLVEGLIELGERFHVNMPVSLDPTSLMQEISRQLRYRGAWLSQKDRREIERETSPEREAILAWDDHMQRFRSDRPLPHDFSERPMREQVALFAWSFRLPPDSRRSIGEVPHALIDAMSMDRSVTPSSALSRFPVLKEYQRFLSRLPRR